MKIDTLAHVKNQISSIIESLGAEPLFITRNGKIAAVLQAMSDNEVEDYLLRNSERFWRLIKSRRAQAEDGHTIHFDAANYRHNATTGSPAVVREKRAEYRVSRPNRKRKSQ